MAGVPALRYGQRMQSGKPAGGGSSSCRSSIVTVELAREALAWRTVRRAPPVRRANVRPRSATAGAVDGGEWGEGTTSACRLKALRKRVVWMPRG